MEWFPKKTGKERTDCEKDSKKKDVGVEEKGQTAVVTVRLLARSLLLPARAMTQKALPKGMGQFCL